MYLTEKFNIKAVKELMYFFTYFLPFYKVMAYYVSEQIYFIQNEMYRIRIFRSKKISSRTIKTNK